MSRVNCPLCKAECTLTVAGKFRDHGPKDNRCDMSGCFIPAEMQTPLPPIAPPQEESCESPMKNQPPTTLPTLNDASESVEPATSTIVSDSDTAPATSTSPITYDQPDRLRPARKEPVPMTEQEQQVVAMLREMFYQYSNRSRRSQQKTMGPSQIGTPCDRKIVMHLLGAPKVNPGGDNWAAFRGTQIHRGLEDMLKWADAGKGRFGTELRVKLNSLIVPGGTLDAIDRVLFMVDDWKTMGQWSLDKLRTTGMSELHRVQLHVYGYGARQRGEKVDYVCLVGWPADESNLENLYCKIEPYRPQIARDALARVDGLAEWVNKCLSDGSSPQEVAQWAEIADDCRYCPYHMRDAADLSNGSCNGRR